MSASRQSISQIALRPFNSWPYTRIGRSWKAGHDVEVRGDVDPRIHRDTAVVPACLAVLGAVSPMVDEAEGINRRELQKEPARACSGRRHAAEPMEVRMGTRLWNVDAAHEKHRVVVIHLIRNDAMPGSPSSVQPTVQRLTLQSTCVATG